MPAGTYASTQTETISDATAGATIYYTTDGTTPTTKSTVYAGPISVAATETIQAIATATGYTQSALAAAAYTVNLPPPGITVSGTAVNVAPGATSGNASTVTVTPTGGFIGSVTVTLTAAVTSSPAGAAYPPSVSFGSTGTVNITSATAGTATLTISTTAPTNAALARSTRRGVPWFAAGGAALACLLFFGIPGRRRSWRTMFGMLALLATLAGGVASCGGSAASNVGSGGVAGTTAGTYTVTVTAASTTTSATGLVTLTVQ